jgi:hypothetical protein
MLKKLKLGLIALVIATTLLGAGARFLPQVPVVFACEPAGHGGGC